MQFVFTSAVIAICIVSKFIIRNYTFLIEALFCLMGHHKSNVLLVFYLSCIDSICVTCINDIFWCVSGLLPSFWQTSSSLWPCKTTQGRTPWTCRYTNLTERDRSCWGNKTSSNRYTILAFVLHVLHTDC